MSPMSRLIAPAALRELLLANTELALLDVREQGVHYQGHPFFACALPLSRLEMMVGELVPRRGVPLVLLDGGGEGLAERAAAKLADLGYTDIAILEGGCAGWKAAGGESFPASMSRPRLSANSSSTITIRRGCRRRKSSG